MKLHYYQETDSLYIELCDKTSSESCEATDGVVIDFDASGNIIGIDVDHASEKLDLTNLEIIELPVKRIKAS